MPHEVQFMLIDNNEIFFAEKKSFGTITITSPKNKAFMITISIKSSDVDNKAIAYIRYDSVNDLISMSDM